MKSTADVVIIGGGIMGASTAYHLAKRGCTNVVVLESGEMFGLGSTGLNAGGIRYQFATAVNIELSKHSIAMMERFATEMDQERRDSALRLSLHARQRGRPRAVPTQRRAAERSTVSRAASSAPRRSPRWRPRSSSTASSAERGVRCDGLVDPHGLLQGYVSNARRLGATLLTGTSATAIDVDGRRRATRRDERRDDRYARRSSLPLDRGRHSRRRWRASTCRFSRFAVRSR